MGGLSRDTPRRALLVLGMHRSGTSAVSRVAMLLGAAGPAHPMGAGPDNPTGFWEPAAVHRLNEAMLAAAGSGWADWAAFAPDPGFEGRAVAALEAEFGDAALFVVKDPRMCRTLQVWLRALEALGAAPSAVLVLRHPGAVARSLAMRNGMPAEHAALLWLRHMLEAERGTRGMPRCVVAYDALLADWRKVAGSMARHLGLVWPCSVGEAAVGVEGFLDPALRHDEGGDWVLGSAYGEVWLRHAWSALCALEREPGDVEAMAALDRVGAQFDDACRLFAPPPLPCPAVLARDGLRQVTICAADSRAPELTARALDLSASRCDAEALLFTDHEVPGRVEIRLLASRDDYSAFMLRGLLEHVRTSHALVVQWDGWVTGPEAWDPGFLEYDYIGARWAWQAPGSDMGNGGFSLRSRRLLEALQHPRYAPVPGMAEDELICRAWRPALERDHGIRFAPGEVADAFAYERTLPERATFGFHGLFNFWRHMDDDALAALAPRLPPGIEAAREFAELTALCAHHDLRASERALVARWRGAMEDGGILSALEPLLGAERAAETLCRC